MSFTYSVYDHRRLGWRVFSSPRPPAIVVAPQETPLRLLTEVRILLPVERHEVGFAPFAEGFVAVEPSELPTQAIPWKTASSSPSSSPSEFLPGVLTGVLAGWVLGGLWA